jgi:hypothetical protein
MTKVFIGIMGLLCISLLLSFNNPSRENNMVQLAIQTVKTQADLSEEVEVKLVEKRESPIPDFYMVKLLVVGKDKEVPIVVYVDRSAEKVIVGTLFIGGKNGALKEAGALGIPKIDLGKLEPGETSLSY